MQFATSGFRTILASSLWLITLAFPIYGQRPEAEVFLKAKMAELGIPGMQVAVVQDGKIIVDKAYGYANLQDSILATTSSVFAINSCTKAFTGVAIMQLVERAKLSLDDPIKNYVDSLPALWQPVTIRQLLTHESGLPDALSIFDPRTHGLAGLRTEAAVWAKVKSMPMQFPTGTQFSYNQTNYILLGKVIDILSQKPFAQFFQDQQFSVAGMRHTSFGDSRDIVPNMAPTYSYRRVFDGVELPAPRLVNNYTEFSTFQRTASGMNSTAADIARWIIALQQGKLLHRAEARRLLWTAGSYNNGSATTWALGWGLTKFRSRHWAVGMSGGGRSAFLVYPSDNLAIIVLTNLAGAMPEDFMEEFAGYYIASIPEADPITRLRIQLGKQGFDCAEQVYAELKRSDTLFAPTEAEINDWAYRMMSKGQLNEAKAILKLNVSLYPESWNVYDSYGEVLMKLGQVQEAINMYKKSLALNPDNQGGKKALQTLAR